MTFALSVFFTINLSDDCPLVYRPCFLIKDFYSAILPVITRGDAYPSFPHTVNSLGQERGAYSCNLSNRNILKYRKLISKEGKEFMIGIFNPFCRCSHIMDFRYYFGKGYQSPVMTGIRRHDTFFSVCQLVHAMHDTNGHLRAAFRAETVILSCLYGQHPLFTGPVTVIMIFPLFREEFDGSFKSCFILFLYRTGDPFVREFCIKYIGLACKLSGGMRIRV